MFKKKRNALHEEMRDIVRSEVPVVLHGLGLVTPRMTVITSAGSKSTYDVKPVEDHAARALAKDAMAAADEALEAAGVARMDAARAVDAAGGTDGSASGEEEDPYIARERQKWDLFEASIAESVIDRVRLEFSDKFEQCVGGLVEESHSSALFLNGLRSIADRQLFELHKLASRLEDIASNFIKSCGTDCHCSSPVVAESEADTSDAPAMTVQEGGGSTAAPDLGAGTVSVFRSRFVVAGRYVYDRDLNKVIDGVALSFGADVLVEMLNAGHADARAYSWEDAK